MERNDVVIINLHELQTAINAILNHVQSSLGKEAVEISRDNYWIIANDDRCNFSGPPTQFNVGSLIDDWEFLRRKMPEVGDLPPAMFVHVASILLHLSDSVEWYEGGSVAQERRWL